MVLTGQRSFDRFCFMSQNWFELESRQPAEDARVSGCNNQVLKYKAMIFGMTEQNGFCFSCRKIPTELVLQPVCLKIMFIR